MAFGELYTLHGYTTFVYPSVAWGTRRSPSFGSCGQCGRECSCIFVGAPITGSRGLDAMIILCLTFWGTAELLPTVAAPFHILTSREWGSSFSASLPTLVVVGFFCFVLFCFFPNDSHLSGGEIHLIVVLTYISLMTNDEHLSMCLLVVYISLEKCLFKVFAHFKI